MAVQQSKPDPRTPNTTADRDPRAFGTIDPQGAEDAANAGPGVLDPEYHDGALVDHNGNSTFSGRRRARAEAANKAVQRGENK